MHRYIKQLLSIIFVLCIAPQAVWAAQTQIRDENGGDYLSTPKKVYTVDGLENKFQADGATRYPDEIYLPNETSPESYRIHSNYTKNTDACASCHATHTAVGASLLQWYNNYDTCMACHDGTVATTYNVAAGVIPKTSQATFGGAFGTGMEAYSSYHNVTGGVLISSAPGNNLAVGLNNEKPLSCESCHSPHGLGGNARLLNPDPNGVQAKQENSFKDYELFQIGETQAQVIYAAYPKNALGDFDFSVDPYYMLKSYPYKVKLTINGQVYSQNDDVFTIDNSAGYTKLYIWKGSTISTISADFIPSLRVRMNITNYLGNGGRDEQVYYRDGSTQFCASCHDDYMNDVASNVYRHPVDVSLKSTSLVIDTESVIYTQAMEHKFEPNQKMVCLTCHYAHGTSQNFWQSNLGYSLENSKENAGSSALKIAPNSDACEVCHGKGDAQEGYNANTVQPHNNPTYGTQDGTFIQLIGITNYVGSNLSSCAGSTCHTSIVNTWKNTLHSKALADASETTIHEDATADWQAAIPKANVLYVLGSKWKQNYVYDDNGVLKVAEDEYVISSGWNKRSAGESSFVEECAGCHTTGLNIATKAWADDGVACEACHGAAKNHLAVPSSRNITNPRYLSVQDQTDVCAQCHTFGYNKDDMRPYPVGYMPHADGLRDTVTRSAYILDNFFTSYTISDYAGNFYDKPNPNTTPAVHDSVYTPQEFNDFVQSKHYKSGVVSCITCHSSHKPNAAKQMLKASFKQTCGACHGTSFNIDAVMPKRSAITNNPNDYLRVHTFNNVHSTDPANTGNKKTTH